MPQILGQNVPWWAIGGAAVVVAGAGYLIYRSRAGATGGQSQQAQSGFSPGASSAGGAATIVPLPYPTPSTSSGSTPSQQIQAIVQPYSQGQNAWLFRSPGSGQPLATIPPGTQVNVTGGAVQGPAQGPAGVTAYYPVTWGGTPGFLSAADVGGFNNPSAQTLQSTQLPAA